MRPKPTPIKPGPGQESAWDYPRPPRLESVEDEVEVFFAEESVAYTDKPMRVLETSHPPVYYFPRETVDGGELVPTGRTSVCEYKGVATYYDVVVGERRAKEAAWSYEHPEPGYEPMTSYVAFFPGKVECLLDGEIAAAQPGDFYGGWVTTRVVGPYKGDAGTMGW